VITEVFTDVEAGTCRTGPPLFQRLTGTKTSSEWCIAVSSGNGQILTALYSVIVTLLFAACWKIVSIAVMSLSGPLDKCKETPDLKTASKYDPILCRIALVGFWNAREPLEATYFTSGFQKRVWPGCRIRLNNWIAVIGVCVASRDLCSGYLRGYRAHLRKGCSGKPQQSLCAKPPGDGFGGYHSLATLRSLGSAEAASNQFTIGKGFSLKSHPSSEDFPQYFIYNYTVTTHDMGLQKWHGLKQEMGGRCDVDSSWFSKNVPEEDIDVYRPWGVANKTVNIVYGGERKTAPSATAISFPYADANFLIHQAVEQRYRIMVHSSHRASYRPGTDPLYKTESFTARENDTDALIEDPPRNRAIGGRPALLCN